MVHDCCIPASGSDLSNDFEEPLDPCGDIEVPLESLTPALTLKQLRDQARAVPKDPNHFSAATAALVWEALSWRTGCGSNIWNAFKSC